MTDKNCQKPQLIKQKSPRPQNNPKVSLFQKGITEQMQQNPFPDHLSKSFENNLQDQATHKVYYDAMMQNRDLFENKIALNLTDGMNLLYSFFAIQAGCQKVYCVISGHSERQLQNIYMMKQIVKQNGKQDCIFVMAWKDFNAEVDIIIGEPMGYCMHFDGMLDRIIQARDLYLNKKGLIFPNSISFKCAIIHDEHFYDHKIQFWNDVYGIPMTSMKKWISHQPMIRVMDPSLIVSKVAKLLTFNIQTVTYNQIIKIDRVFQLDLLGQCRANGLVFWFEVSFDHGIEKKEIKASPWVDSTKFTQVTLYWPIVQSYKGGKLRIRVKGQKYPKEGYSVIKTEVDNKIYQYSFS